jgi:hypothetical protein
MLPVVIVKVVQIAAGIVVGNLASDAVDKVVVEAKKIVEKKKAEKA